MARSLSSRCAREPCSSVTPMWTSPLTSLRINALWLRFSLATNRSQSWSTVGAGRISKQFWRTRTRPRWFLKLRSSRHSQYFYAKLRIQSAPGRQVSIKSAPVSCLSQQIRFRSRWTLALVTRKRMEQSLSPEILCLSWSVRYPLLRKRDWQFSHKGMAIAVFKLQMI